jgi:hypothetical protein
MVAGMSKPVRWMTLQELRDDLDRTRPAWESQLAHLDGVLADGEPADMDGDANRHRLIAEELLRRPSEG